MSDDGLVEPSGIGQFIEHDRCQRYLKQRFDPGKEPDAREWQEAFGSMNIALLGAGQEFEAKQIEGLAADATTVIGPDCQDRSKAGAPDITIDETWEDSPEDQLAQLTSAVEQATGLSSSDDVPYILLYQAPLNGQLGNEEIYGEADCIVLAPATGWPDTTRPNAESDAQAVVARVIDCKNAQEEQPAHRVQVAAYCALLEQTLAEAPYGIDCRIEASVLTQEHAVKPGEAQPPFDLPTFHRAEWELFVTQMLDEDGPVTTALETDLQDLPFALNPVCNNCAYREACATRAVENPRSMHSLALLGLDPGTQRTLEDTGLASLHDIATLAPPHRNTTPMDDPPQLELDGDLRRTLEETLPYPPCELILRAQALYGGIEPDYPEYRVPPAIPGTDWVPLPDDREHGWGGIDDAEPGELIHVALVVRPDTAINRVAALGACVTADDYDGNLTIGELIDAVPDDEDRAADAEATLLERFLTQLFDGIEQVATAVGEPEQAVLHCYTYSEHELDALTAALERHSDTVDRAHALRALCSLNEDGHTSVDQSMVTPVQPVINDHFALQSPSQGLLSVVDQFAPDWTINSFDPQDMRPDEPLLREIFGEQFLSDAVPYTRATPGIHLQLGGEPLGEGPATAENDGWYRIRKRSGSQFPLEYIWAAVPKHPDDDQPRLHPDVVDEWVVDDEHEPLYRQEIGRFYYRTNEGNEPLQREDVTALVERLSYALSRLVETIPYKNTYKSKEPVDVTQLATFKIPVGGLAGAARDYLHMEFGAAREDTLAHYRSSLRARARTGRSVPIRCTDYTIRDDGTLTVTANLAYEELFGDPDTAQRVAQQARLRATNGTSGGSWRVLTPLIPTTDDVDSDSGPAQPGLKPRVDDPEDTKHSPPVIVDEFDVATGEIVLTAFPHRFRRYGRSFRVDHCGWVCKEESNLNNLDATPAERDGYVANRPPVTIDSGALYMLDPMIDDLSAPKTIRALSPETIRKNPLWQQLQEGQQADCQPQTLPMVPSAGTEEFCEQMTKSDTCLTPNTAQQQFITAVDRPLVALQGPPGTGKTSGAIAPALLARAYTHAQCGDSFTGIVVAPSHEAVDAVLEGVVGCLDNWRTTASGLTDLKLVRVTPTPLSGETHRVDTTTPQVDVMYAAYHSDAGTATLSDVARAMTAGNVNPAQQLLFTTPASLYRVFRIVAETCSVIDGSSAPAAMRYTPGLADVICLDEASMLNLPELFLATSVLRPTGQTLLVGDHRQLATISNVDWAETRRQPLLSTGAYHSALEYIQDVAVIPESGLSCVTRDNDSVGGK